jgi:hypothetical protein
MEADTKPTVELPVRSLQDILMTYGAFAGRRPTDNEMIALLIRESDALPILGQMALYDHLEKRWKTLEETVKKMAVRAKAAAEKA